VKLGGKRPNHRDLTDEHRLKALEKRQIRASGPTSLRAIAAALDDRGSLHPEAGTGRAATVSCSSICRIWRRHMRRLA
jgi:hypothetical protein